MRITPNHILHDKFLIGIDTEKLRMTATAEDYFGAPVRIYRLSEDYALVEMHLTATSTKFYRVDYEEALGYLAGSCKSIKYN